MERLITKGAALVLMAWTAMSCEQDPYMPDDPCAAGFVDFQNEIQPLIASRCAMSGCHDAGTQAEGVRLDNYSGIRDEVKPFDPSDSDLMEAINESGDERMPPPPNPPLSASEKALITLWIEQGAQNLNCETSCDTLQTLSYALDIQPLVQTNCVGCHNANLQSGYLRLDSYAYVSAAIDQNALLFRINPAVAGAGIMPPSGAMSLCAIAKINLWDQQGRQP